MTQTEETKKLIDTDSKSSIRKLIEADGKTHINIYTKGQTQLGKQLAQFYQASFTHPYFGPFDSMECFYQYIRTMDFSPEKRAKDSSLPRRDELRYLSGKQAKELGKRFPRAPYDAQLSLVIDGGNFYKIEQNPDIKKAFLESTLPFDHYFEFGEGNLPIRPKYADKVIKGFTLIRELMRKGEKLPEVDYSRFIHN